MMANLAKFDPFAEFESLKRQFFGDDFLTPRQGSRVPTTDVYTEDDKQLTVEAHLPNFANEDVDVRIDDGALVISAERHEREEDKQKKYVVRESSSSFYRRIQLPERADTTAVVAEFKQGVLKVMIPLTALPEPQKIAVKTD